MKDRKKNPIGIAYVGFESENDLEQAMGRNMNCIGGKRIYLNKSHSDLPEEVTELKPRPWELKKTEHAEEGEGIAETGRLFVRNLSYLCKEEDLEKLFKKYGSVLQFQPENSGGAAPSDDEDTEVGSTLFVKNLNFSTTDDGLRQVFDECSRVKLACVAMKKDLKNPVAMLSMGYGFVKGLKRLEPAIKGRTKQKTVKQKTTKILVRNIPFEAKRKEVEELFKVFGELKMVRLPKKMSGTGSHRGFGFVDFLTRQDAKRAFEALCHSTHLYGRRLVLEWAEQAEDIEDIRKRTAEHFHDDDVTKKKLTKAGLKDHLEKSHDV